MAAYLCLTRSPLLPWLAAFGCLLAFAYSSGFGFFTAFLTSSSLILCPVIVSRSKSNHLKSTLKEETQKPFQQVLSLDRVPVCDHIENECVFDKGAQISEKNENTQSGNYLFSSSDDSLSDSEGQDHTTLSDDSENDWMKLTENQSHSTEISDGSISDEEGLIEIALPENHYVDSNSRKQDQTWYNFQQQWPDCSFDSHFRQQNLLEMMNEEDNLIEIDIFMGNIKCTRFEIEA